MTNAENTGTEQPNAANTGTARLSTKLQRTNFVAGSLHLGLAVAFIVTSATSKRRLNAIKTSTVSVQPEFQRDRSTGRVAEVTLVTQTETDEFPLQVLIVAFVLITALFHLGLGLDRRGWYAQNIDNGCNPFRWLEYGITASIMLLIIAFSFGLREFNTLLVIFALNALVMCQGYLVEVLIEAERRGAAWVVTVTSWLAYVAYWVVLAKTAITAAGRLTDFLDPPRATPGATPGATPEATPEAALKKIQGDTPSSPTGGAETGDGTTVEELQDLQTLIIAVLATTFLLFSCFAVVQVVHLAKGKTVKYERYEMAYIVLSAVSKTTLISLLFWGLYGRSNSENSSIEDTKCK